MNNLLRHDPAALESNTGTASDTVITDDFGGSEIASLQPIRQLFGR